MAAPGEGAGAAPAPAGGANAQALIAKHAAQTQANAGADAAIVARVENSIKHSPMGWLQSQMGEVSSRQASEGGEINGKVAESRDIIAKNQSKAPPEAGPPPKQGAPVHPAIEQHAAHVTASASPKPATGGTPAPHTPAPAVSAQTGSPSASAPEVPAPLMAQISAVTSDPQLDAILNAYSPKSDEAPNSIGRIRQMGDVAKGFSGQLEVYVAKSGTVEAGIAKAANFIGVGKDASAVWANNPYRQMHGVLGGIMTGLSAVKGVAGVVGSICSKLGLLLTVVGVLGMIFPPIGGALLGIARIINVVGIICDAISAALGGILTGLNGIMLAQQIASGSTAEEKAATADLMMNESQDAAGGLLNLAMVFGGGFMKGLLGSSKGVVGSLMKRAKAVIGKIVSKAGNNVSAIASKVWRKMGFGGVDAERVGGQWVNRAPGGFSRAMSATGRAIGSVPERLQGVQDKLMAKYGNTGWSKGMERVGAWSQTTASHWDIEEKLGNAGKSVGKALNQAGAKTAFATSMETGTQEVERQTREASARAAAADAGDLEKRRWDNLIDDRRATRDAGTISPAAQERFASAQGARVAKAEEPIALARENAAARTERDAAARETRETEASEHTAKDYGNNTGRDDVHQKLEDARLKRQRLEVKHEGDLARREQLQAIAEPTAAQEQELRRLDKRLVKLEDAREVNIKREEAFSRITRNGGEEGQRNMENWSDLAFNVKGRYGQIREASLSDAGAHRIEAGREWNAKHETVGKGPDGEDQSVEASRADALRDRAHDLVSFVRATPATSAVGTRVKTLLATTGRSAPAAAPAPAIAAAPAASAAIAPATAAAPVAAAPVPAPAEPLAAAPIAATAAVPEGVVPAAGPAPEAAAAPPADAPASADALAYWPALLPQFEAASGDFGYMRRVAVEFKKAQIEGKQKAVDTLAIYGKYEEYAALRKQQAAAHAAASRQTGAEASANTEHAGAGAEHAAQGEAKQDEAKGQANNRAAVNLPEPEVSGFWGRLLGGAMLWAKNKAAEVFGWIQDKIATVILYGLCGITMGDLRDYTGALRRQQAAAHGVAEGAASTAGEAGQKQIKLGGDANKASQEAVQAIGECDQNLNDADSFMSDVTQFEQQLAEEKANAQAFIAQVHAAAHAEQAKAAAAQGAQAGAEGAAAAGGPVAAVATAAPTPAPAPAPEAAPAPTQDAAPASDEAASGEIRAAIDLVASSTESMTQQLDTRGEDYINQLAMANAKGRDAKGTDLRTPAKLQSKKIVEGFKESAAATNRELAPLGQMSIEPSSARRIADTVIAAADHLDQSFQDSENQLDLLFSRTYAAIRAGRDDAAAAAPTNAPPAVAATTPPPAAAPAPTAE